MMTTFMNFSLLVLIAGLYSCNPLGGEKANVDFRDPSVFKNLSTNISAVSVVNNQLVIDGTKLSTIQNVTLINGSQTESFAVESVNDSQIIANGVQAISIAAGSVFDLILSSAYASATYQVTFGLANNVVTTAKIADGAVTGAKIGVTANAGDFLKYNGTTWVAAGMYDGQTYQGAWDASTNTFPALSSPGDYYIVSVAGSFGSPLVSYSPGDWIITDGYAWQKVGNSKAVSSFQGRRGVVTLQPSDYVTMIDTTTNKLTGSKISDIADVDFSTPPTVGQVLKWNNTTSKWVPGDDTAGASGIALTSLSATSPLAYNSTAGVFSTSAVAITALPLTNLASGTGAIVATDTILGAFGKLMSIPSDYVSKSGNTTMTTGTLALSGAAMITVPTATGTTLTEVANVTYVNNAIAANGQWTKGASSSINYTAGNVGIGTTASGSYKLNVNGTANFTDNISAPNIAYSDSTKLYYGVPAFTPASNQTISSSGTTVTITNPVAYKQFENGNNLVGSKLVINNESRLITNVSSASQVTVDSAYSQNYSNVPYTNWNLYSVGLRMDSSGLPYFYTGTQQGGAPASSLVFSYESGFVNTQYSWKVGNDYNLWNQSWHLASGLSMNWSSNGLSSGTKDLGIRRSGAGALEIYDGNTAGTYRDLYLRNLFTNGNVGVGTTTPAQKLDVYGNIAARGAGYSSSPYVGGIGVTNYMSALSFRGLGNFTGAIDFLTNNVTSDSAPTVKMTLLPSGALVLNAGQSDGSALFYVNGDASFKNMKISDESYTGTRGIDFPNYKGSSNRGAFIDYTGNGNYTGYLSFGTNNSASDTDATEKMRITSAGNVGISTTVPQALLQIGTTSGTVPSGTALFVPAQYATVGGLNVGFGTNPAIITTDDSSKGISFRINGTEYYRLHTNGFVGIGINAPTSPLHVNTSNTSGNIASFVSSGAGGAGCSIAWNGTSCSSDARLKENIQSLDSKLQIENIMKLNPVHFTWIKDRWHKIQSGFIAQEMEKVFPEFVKTEDNGYKQINYAHFVSVLTSGVQETFKTIMELKQDFLKFQREIKKIVMSLIQNDRNHDALIEALQEENRALREYLCEKDEEASFCHR